MALGQSRPLLTRLAAYGLTVPLYALGTRVGSVETNPVLQPPSRLLIVKVHGMGDSVLIRALIQLLQLRHPEIEIGVMVGAATRELMTTGLRVRSHGYDQRKVTPYEIVSTWRGIRRGHYEAIANFEQRSTAGTAFLASARIGTHVGFASDTEDAKWRLLTHRVMFRESDSMWQSFLRLSRVLYPDLPDGPPSIELQSSAESKSWARNWWYNHVGSEKRFVVAMHVGCGRGAEFRRWPLARFVALADRIKSRWRDSAVILTGTARERDLIRQFQERFRGIAIDASDFGSIEKTALVLKYCQLLVSNDTGVMHLGAAVGTPTVGLFGASSPTHWAPLGRCASYVRGTSLECSPCMNNYLNLIPARCTNHVEGQCMKDITVESVESEIERLVGYKAAMLHS
jgi:ADP-heptose:LPS heptosyltransferase